MMDWNCWEKWRGPLPREIEWVRSTPAENPRAMAPTLNICRIDCASEDVREAILELRRQLSPKGNVVSPQGRARTIAAFGEPLTPQQVVERICADVQCRGLDAVLDYTARLDGVTLDPASVRVSRDEMVTAWRSRPGLPQDAPPHPR